MKTLRALFCLALVFMLSASGLFAALDAGTVDTLFAQMLNLQSLAPADQGYDKAVTEVSRFFEAVTAEAAKSGGGGRDAIEVLRELKAKKGGDWQAEARQAEANIMETIRQVLIREAEGLFQGKGPRPFGDIIAIGYSGKWPIAAGQKLTFEMDFDITFFGSKADTDPTKQGGVVQALGERIRMRLKVSVSGANIVITGGEHTMASNVYVSRRGIRWAVENMFGQLWINPRSGQVTRFPEGAKVFYVVAMLYQNQELYPDLFPKEGQPPTQAQLVKYAQELMAKRPRASAEGASAGVIDMWLHLSEISESTVKEGQLGKIVKQVARAHSIFTEDMSKGRERLSRLCDGAQQTFIEKCVELEGLRIKYAQQIQSGQRAEAAQTDTSIQELVEWFGGKDVDIDKRSKEAESILNKMAKHAHNAFIANALETLPPEQAEARLRLYIEDLKKLETAAKQRGSAASQTRIAKSLKSATDLLTTIQGNFPTFRSMGRVMAKVYTLFDLANRRDEGLKDILKETELGRKILADLPEWFWDKKPPKEFKYEEFESMPGFYESLLKPVHDTTHLLVVLDLGLQFADIWYDTKLDNGQRFLEMGKVLFLMRFWQLYPAVAIYHASYSGDFKEVAGAVVFAVAAYICPPLMVPDLVKALGARVVDVTERAVFVEELGAMFENSTFDPPFNDKVPNGWKRNPDLVQYKWQSFSSYAGYTYDKKTLTNYIVRVANRELDEVPSTTEPIKTKSDEARGAYSAIVPNVVPRAFRRIVEKTEPVYFTSHRQFMDCLDNLRRFDCIFMVPYLSGLPSQCDKTSWMITRLEPVKIDLLNNALGEGEDERLRGMGKYGETTLNTLIGKEGLLRDRAVLRNGVLRNLVECMITSFEDEARDRTLVKLGLIDNMTRELRKIGEQLGIADQLIQAVTDDIEKTGVSVDAKGLAEDPGQYSDMVQQKIAKVLDRWIPLYRSIRDTRVLMMALADAGGVPVQEAKMILYGMPPLQVDRFKDSTIAGETRTVLPGVREDAKRILAKIKGGELFRDDRDRANTDLIAMHLMIARIMELRCNQVYGMQPVWEAGPAAKEEPAAFAQRVTDDLRRRIATYGFSRDLLNLEGKRWDPEETLNQYSQWAENYARKLKEIEESYKKFDLSMAIKGDKETEVGRPVPLSAELVPKQPHQARMLKWVKVAWSNNVEVGSAEGLFYQYGAAKEGSCRVHATAYWLVDGKKAVLAEQDHAIWVAKAKEVVPSGHWTGTNLIAQTNQVPVAKRKNFAELSEQEKGALLNCLCRCGSGADPDVMVGWSPGKPGQWCHPKCYGPCICDGFGHWHNFPSWDEADPCVSNCFTRFLVYYDKDALKDIVRKNIKPLQLEVTADRLELDLDDVVQVQAKASQGWPGYSYEWSSNVEGKGASAKFEAERPGEFVVSCTAYDTDGASVTKSLTIKVMPLTVRVEKIEPATDEIPLGTVARFRAVVSSGTRPGKGTYFYQWEPIPEVDFNPFVGSAKETTARFQRTGPVGVWVNVARQKGEAYIPCGESEVLPLTVQAPALNIVIAPAEPQVGQETKLTVEGKNLPDDVTYVWDLPANVILRAVSQSTREIVILPRDREKVEILCRSRLAFYGIDLAEKAVSFTPKTYTVKAKVEGPLFGSRPTVWDPVKKSLVPAPAKEFLVGEIIRVTATLEGEPKPPKVLWRWTVNRDQGATLNGGDTSPEVHVSRSAPGTVEATVVASDENGLELGRDMATLEITANQDQNQPPPGLNVVLTAEPSSIALGSSAVVRASVQGGKPPYAYAWSGATEVQGNWCRVKSRHTGTTTVRVTVTDDKQAQKQAATTITVTDPTAAVDDKGTDVKPPSPPDKGSGAGGTNAVTAGKGAGAAAAPKDQLAAPPPGGGTACALELPRKNVSPGQPIVVRIANPPKEKLAWVGFYRVGAGNKDYLKYTFLNALDKNTWEDVLAPDEPGAYNIRIFRDESYTPVAVSEPIEVTR